jgi:ribonuclease T1
MRITSRALRASAARVALVGAVLLGSGAVYAGTAEAAAPVAVHQLVTADDLSTSCLSTLPSQVDDTLNLIASDGPFPFSKDGEVYYNDNGDLPQESDGYYHSYTVITPGASNRGARRVVTGDDGTDYYTADHYDTFVIIDTSC